MDPDPGTTPGGGIDRRRLIQRAGVLSAGLAAWSTPMVTSLAGTAHAAGSVPTACRNPFSCNGAPAVACALNCVCARTADGSGRCAIDVPSCDDLQRCDGGAPCPDGTFCAYDTCCGAPVCLPDCNDQGSSRTGSRSGRRPFAAG